MNIMRKKSILLLFLIVVLTFSTAKIRTSVSTPDATISVFDATDGDTEVVGNPPSDVVTVEVNITDASNVAKWEFYLSYDTSMLYTDESYMVEGPFLSNVGTTSGLKVSIELGLGVKIGCYLMVQGGASGDGTLVTITFLVEDSGRCTLDLHDSSLTLDEDPPLTEYPTEEDGTFYSNIPKADFVYSTENHPSTSPGHQPLFSPVVDEIITFNATGYVTAGGRYGGSYDPDGTIDSYEWDFGDETTVTETDATTTHAYEAAGTYRVNLTITDNEGYADFRDRSISVVVHDIAIIEMTANSTTASPGEVVSINVTVKNEGTKDNWFNLTCTYDSDFIWYNQTDDKKWFCLAIEKDPDEPQLQHPSLQPDENMTVTFIWNTTGVSGGTYEVGANATLTDNGMNEILGEADTADNQAHIDITLEVPRDIAVTDVTAHPTNVLVGDTVYIDVTVTNEGDMTETSIEVTPYYDGTAAASPQTVASLAVGASETLQFEWDTTGVPKDTYTISANASVVPGETDTADNTRTGNSVTVREPGDPVANFTYSPEKPSVNEEVTFNASASEPDGGTIERYEWDFGDDTTAIYEDANLTDTANHTYTEAGPYIVTLNVTDSEGKSGTTDRTITIYGPPIANFTYSPSAPVVDIPVTFNATASYDPDGGNETYPSGIVSYEWDFDDETPGTGNIAEHTYTEYGEYNVTLAVIDDENVANSTWKLITVYAPPIANFTHSPSQPIVNQTAAFNASASSDPDGTIINYTWNFGDSNTTTVTDPIITHVYTENKTYTVTLNVTDNDELNGTFTSDVTVITRGEPPVADAGPDQTVYVNTLVTFNASASSDPDGTIVSYEWDFDDGTNATETDPIANHTYTQGGTYTVTLTVRDAANNTDTDTVTVTVQTLGPVSQGLSIQISGEREYSEDEDVEIRLAALVMNQTMEPALGATVTISIYDPDGNLWNSSNMVERLKGTGIYEWESKETIKELELQKGFYLIHIQASYKGLRTSQISQLHIAAAEKIASIISIDANPTSVTAGSSVTLSGAITPKRPGVTVTILTRPKAGNWSVLTTVKTSATGHYSLGWVETTPGTYEVKANWSGDTRAEGAESEVKTVTVHGSGLLPLEIHPYVIMATAAIIGSIVGSIVASVVLMRMRKPKPP